MRTALQRCAVGACGRPARVAGASMPCDADRRLLVLQPTPDAPGESATTGTF